MNTEAPATQKTPISRQWLLNRLLARQTTCSDAYAGYDTARAQQRAIGMEIGQAMAAHYYTLRHRAPINSPEQFVELLDDVHADLQVAWSLHDANAQEIVYAVAQCPWEDELTAYPGYCAILRAIYGTLAALSFGHARATIEPLTADRRGCCLLHLDLRPHVDESDPDLFTRKEIHTVVQGATDMPMFTPSLKAPGVERQHVADGDYETLYHRQLQLTERLEQALEMERAAAEQLRAFSRLKQDFLSNVSHEFRTPITTIQGYLSLMEQGSLGTLSEEQTEALHIAMRNVDRLNRLVNDVLDFSSLARGQFLLEGEVVDVTAILSQAVLRTADFAKLQDVRLRYEPAETPGKVLGDPERLVQMITHLLENAIKFSDSGQEVVVSAYRRPHQVAIEITDSGIGMTQEQLARVFTPFVQGETGLTRRYGGLGMGLSLIHNLVALHGGEIHITSEPGCGTTVVMTLPLLGG